MPTYDYDLVAIGAGTGGLTVTRLVAAKGKRVALIERDRPGGDCLYTGCVPTKALIEAAKLLYQARHGQALGVLAEDARLDFPAVRRHLRRAQQIAGAVESPEAIARMRKVFPGVGVCFVKPRNNWPGVREPMGVMCYPSFMIVGAHVPEDVVYKVTKTMHDNPKALGEGFGALRGFKPDRMNLAHPTPYHAGAIKYYKEIGQWPPPAVK